METPQWTKDRPAESGFYWYRESGDDPEVIEWDAHPKSVSRTGSDVALCDHDAGYGWNIDGEFWPEAIRPPNATADLPPNGQPDFKKDVPGG